MLSYLGVGYIDIERKLLSYLVMGDIHTDVLRESLWMHILFVIMWMLVTCTNSLIYLLQILDRKTQPRILAVDHLACAPTYRVTNLG